MDNKTFAFHGTAGGYFVVFIVSLITVYIPFFGWAFGFNFTNQWIADNSEINGRKIKYSAGYGEVLKFVFVNFLLLLVTFGIYTFWFTPKTYRFVADHMSFADEVPVAAVPVSESAPATVPAQESSDSADSSENTPPTAAV